MVVLIAARFNLELKQDTVTTSITEAESLALSQVTVEDKTAATLFLLGFVLSPTRFWFS